MSETFNLILAIITISVLLALNMCQRQAKIQVDKEIDSIFNVAMELSKESYKRGWLVGHSRGRNYPYAEARQLFEADSIDFNNLIEVK